MLLLNRFVENFTVISFAEQYCMNNSDLNSPPLSSLILCKGLSGYFACNVNIVLSIHAYDLFLVCKSMTVPFHVLPSIMGKKKQLLFDAEVIGPYMSI
jgi:hypothetical protein